ncbi:penicillin-binding protein activator [Methylobrevis albus]|uniref:Penicillin-binding protein activator n=1 Tax=Methylobrevis albus TaxID=2793297 RepID=A0A931MYW4_9HYPH|nr:penicillin-binding protein activator [Methylobrevis albus]MBH0237399.1 penicillin-binding protein activator [Methylobrevis albus]
MVDLDKAATAREAAAADARRTGGGIAGLTRRGALGVMAAGLAACVPNRGGSLPPLAPPPITSAPLPGPVTGSGETIGSGSVRIGLLIPRSAGGNAASIATALRNAGQMAFNDFAGADVTILVKDSGGTAEGAAAATQQAIAEGAELILGPFFAAEVRGAAPVALAANVPVIAFSSDPSVAGNGVYIMGFLIGDEVTQMVAQASAMGRRSVGALISDSAAGTLAEAALRQSAARYNVRIVQVERFSTQPADMQAKALALAGNRSQMDAVFMPDGIGIAPGLASALNTGGGTPLTLLGSGQWNDPALFNVPSLAGGLFPAPEIERFNAFTARYRQLYGAEPFAKATLGYDAVLLACGLVRQAGPRRFDRAVIANPQGFISSINGLFRFRPDGTNDRGLAIYEMTGTAPRLVQPAPRVFTGA